MSFSRAGPGLGGLCVPRLGSEPEVSGYLVEGRTEEISPRAAPEQFPVWGSHPKTTSLQLSRKGAGAAGEGMCASEVTIHLHIFPGGPRGQNLFLDGVWGCGVEVVGGCVQKWEEGSWLWNCLEIDINQDNGLGFLGPSWWALAQAETQVRTLLVHTILAPLLCASVFLSVGGWGAALIITPLPRAF